MWNLIFIALALALLVGFFSLTDHEARSGVRILAFYRGRLDHIVERIVFVFENVNLGAFLRDEIRHLAGRIGHDIVHFSLIIVRSIERLLTSLVRRLRNHPEIDTAPRETAREFVKTLSDFKGNLNATHPEISDIK
jgi:hypothetical protein